MRRRAAGQAARTAEDAVSLAAYLFGVTRGLAASLLRVASGDRGALRAQPVDEPDPREPLG